MNNELFPYLIYLKVVLARLIILSILLILSKKLVLISVHSWFNQNTETNPKRTQTNPIFQTPNPILSPKTRILDNFRQHFLCKTKPFFSKIQIENKGLTAVSQSSPAVYPAPTLRLFRKHGAGVYPVPTL